MGRTWAFGFSFVAGTRGCGGGSAGRKKRGIITRGGPLDGREWWGDGRWVGPGGWGPGEWLRALRGDSKAKRKKHLPKPGLGSREGGRKESSKQLLLVSLYAFSYSATHHTHHTNYIVKHVGSNADS